MSNEVASMVKHEFLNYLKHCYIILRSQQKIPTIYQGDGTGEIPSVMAPFPPPPMLARMQDLFILYSKEYRAFSLNIFHALLLKNTDYSKESYLAYKKFRDK